MSNKNKQVPTPEQKIQLTDWQDLPRIELYMDQVISILQDEMRGLWVHPEEAKISASMVNNYVKVKLVPAPNKKRYDRCHICALLLVFILKTVLSMQELALLLPSLIHAFEQDWEQLHNCFIKQLRLTVESNDTHDAVVCEANSEYAQVMANAVQAFAKRLSAQRLLNRLTNDIAGTNSEKLNK